MNQSSNSAGKPFLRRTSVWLVLALILAGSGGLLAYRADSVAATKSGEETKKPEVAATLEFAPTDVRLNGRL